MKYRNFILILLIMFFSGVVYAEKKDMVNILIDAGQLKK